jgi:hypothetical protein
MERGLNAETTMNLTPLPLFQRSIRSYGWSQLKVSSA